MKPREKAIEILTKSGYQFRGDTIIPPDADCPLDAISIQSELSEIVDNGHTFQLQYIGDKLKLIEVEI